MKLSSLLLLLITSLIYISCSASEPAARGDAGEDEMRESFDAELGVSEEFAGILESSRSDLSDQFTVKQHDVPEQFLKEIVVEERETDEYAGYRIQILSTRDVSLADSTKLNFQVWADTTFQQYTPEAYIFFRQPQYRVHVGDFRERERAIQLSRYLKSRYPDAWVVHDRINPENVPADTTRIEPILE